MRENVISGKIWARWGKSIPSIHIYIVCVYVCMHVRTQYKTWHDMHTYMIELRHCTNLIIIIKAIKAIYFSDSCRSLCCVHSDLNYPLSWASTTVSSDMVYLLWSWSALHSGRSGHATSKKSYPDPSIQCSPITSTAFKPALTAPTCPLFWLFWQLDFVLPFVSLTTLLLNAVLVYL